MHALNPATRLSGSPMESVVQRLLIQGGDERIALDAATGLNRYACAAVPFPGEITFASSTASTISDRAYAAAGPEIEHFISYGSDITAYAVEAAYLRQRLAAYCGLPPLAADGILLAPSGTDLHLIVADLARGERRARLTTVFPDARETGRGVSAAVGSRRFSVTTPHGGACASADLLPDAIAGGAVSVALRSSDGSPRNAKCVDDDFERAVLTAAKGGGPVLLILVDTSKTGLVAPSLACAESLKARLGENLMVMVDACQFRLSGRRVGDYLAQDFYVAVTGSKFLTGPAFSGALFIPPASAERVRRHAPLRALGDYSSRHDWPSGCAARSMLPDTPNLGLLLRWNGALHEFDAFQRNDPDGIRDLAASFARVVTDALARSPNLRLLATPPLARPGLGEWDATQTIFSFVGLRDGRPIGAGPTEMVYRSLLCPGPSQTRRPVRLGQPVTVGEAGGEPINALRVSISARDISLALASPGGPDALCAKVIEALEATARTIVEL
jgi:hypothetical protein